MKSSEQQYFREYYRKHREKIRARQAKYYQANLEKLREYDRARYPTRVEEVKRRAVIWNKAHPAVKRAHTLLNDAVRAGRLSRPSICQKCGTSEHRIEGHHEDYTKPYDVIWLCTPCRRLADIARRKRLASEANPS